LYHEIPSSTKMAHIDGIMKWRQTE
jgi:hypothetical protein